MVALDRQIQRKFESSLKICLLENCYIKQFSLISYLSATARVEMPRAKDTNSGSARSMHVPRSSEPGALSLRLFIRSMTKLPIEHTDGEFQAVYYRWRRSTRCPRARLQLARCSTCAPEAASCRLSPGTTSMELQHSKVMMTFR